MPPFLEDVASIFGGQRTESWCGRITVPGRILQYAIELENGWRRDRRNTDYSHTSMHRSWLRTRAGLVQFANGWLLVTTNGPHIMQPRVGDLLSGIDQPVSSRLGRQNLDVAQLLHVHFFARSCRSDALYPKSLRAARRGPVLFSIIVQALSFNLKPVFTHDGQ